VAVHPTPKAEDLVVDVSPLVKAESAEMSEGQDLLDAVLPLKDDATIDELVRIQKLLQRSVEEEPTGAHSLSLDNATVLVNSRLNQEEYKRSQSELYSYPQSINVGIHYRCNAKCVFCIGTPPAYQEFSLGLFRDFYEARAATALRKAHHLFFCGFGEPLASPDVLKFIEYLNARFSGPMKSFTTNGIALNRPVLDRMFDGNFQLQVSLHASASKLHSKLTGTRTFDEIVNNLRYVCRRRRETGSRLWVQLIFVIGAMNVRDIPDFVRLAIDLGVDGVTFSYLTVFTKEQIRQSCFFDKELTNEMIQLGRSIGASAGLSMTFPPLFDSAIENDFAEQQPCRYPWDWIYLSTEGVNYCCYSVASVGQLKDSSFEEIWNSETYQRLRSDLIHGVANDLCRNCYKASQTVSIDDFRAHVTGRAAGEEIVKEYEQMQTESPHTHLEHFGG